MNRRVIPISAAALLSTLILAVTAILSNAVPAAPPLTSGAPVASGIPAPAAAVSAIPAESPADSPMPSVSVPRVSEPTASASAAPGQEAPGPSARPDTTGVPTGAGSKAAATAHEVVSAAPADGGDIVKTAYLTFDDGPSKATAKLLDILKSSGVRATFFVVGTNAEKYPELLKRMTNEGHIIGNHTWSHTYSTMYKDLRNFMDDFNKLNDFITQVTGVTPAVCRFPGGTNNTVSRSYNRNHIMKSVADAVAKLGFTYYDWNVSSGESGSTVPTAAEIESSVVGQCRGKSTAVILFHDTGNLDFNNAVPGIISKLRSMGYAFSTLSPDNPADRKTVQFKPT